MKIALFGLALLGSAAMIACDESPTGSATSSPAIVASYEYINFAWGYRHGATYIDSRGAIWDVTYSVDDSICVLLDTTRHYTPEVFAVMLEGADLVGTILNRDTLRTLKVSAGEVAKGTWDGCYWSGSDFGTAVTSLYYKVGGNYADRVKLKQWGDQTCSNDHPKAAALSDIVEGYALTCPID